MDRWIVTPRFFEEPEPALLSVCPPDVAVNDLEIEFRTPPELALIHGGIANFVTNALAEGHRPVSVAGDCCCALPVLAGMHRAGLDPDLVWIDAHGDFNTPETSPSQFLGGMPLAMAVGRGPQWMCEGIGLRPISEEQVLLVDARDLDPLEEEALKGSRVTHIPLSEISDIQFNGPVLLHLDVDVIDAEECGAFRYPVARGPSSYEVAAALADMERRSEIAAVSVSGWTGSLDRDGSTARAVAHILESLQA